MSKWDKIKQAIGIPDDEDEFVSADEIVEEKENGPANAPKKDAYRSAGKSANGQVNMVIIRSNDYSDARTVADHILSNRAVLLNLENCNKEMAQRILDFLSGVVYSQGGDLQRVAHSTYAVTPRNVGLQGELAEEYRTEEF